MLLFQMPFSVMLWVTAYTLFLIRQAAMIRSATYYHAVTTGRALRSLLTFGAASYVYVDNTLSSGALISIIAFTFLSILGDRFVGEAEAYLPYAVNFPAKRQFFRKPSKVWNIVRHLYLASLLLSPGAFFVTAFTEDATFWNLTWVAAAIVMGIAPRLYSRSKLALFSHQRSTEYEQLPVIVSEYRPSFAVHWDGPAASLYQLKMWLPHLKNIGLPFVIYVRPISGRSAILEAVGNDVPLVFTPKHSDLERVLAPSITVAFYVNNADRNNQLLRFRKIHHVQLGHGDSDKATSTGPVFRMFDQIFVAGNAAIDRFLANDPALPRSKFEIIGRPQLSEVSSPQQPICEKQQPTILYAPTWKGDFADSAYSSLSQIEPLILRLIERGCRIIFRAHPFTSRDQTMQRAATQIDNLLRREKSISGVEHLSGKEAEHDLSITQCFNLSDALITDVSSVLTDYLASNKPVAVYTPSTTVNFPAVNCVYNFTPDSSTWTSVLDDFLGQDSFKGRRALLKSHYLGSTDPVRAFTDAVLKAINNSARPSRDA